MLQLATIPQLTGSALRVLRSSSNYEHHITNAFLDQSLGAWLGHKGRSLEDRRFAYQPSITLSYVHHER